MTDGENVGFRVGRVDGVKVGTRDGADVGSKAESKLTLHSYVLVVVGNSPITNKNTFS